MDPVGDDLDPGLGNPGSQMLRVDGRDDDDRRATRVPVRFVADDLAQLALLERTPPAGQRPAPHTQLPGVDGDVDGRDGSHQPDEGGGPPSEEVHHVRAMRSQLFLHGSEQARPLHPVHVGRLPADQGPEAPSGVVERPGPFPIHEPHGHLGQLCGRPLPVRTPEPHASDLVAIAQFPQVMMEDEADTTGERPGGTPRDDEDTHLAHDTGAPGRNRSRKGSCLSDNEPLCSVGIHMPPSDQGISASLRRALRHLRIEVGDHPILLPLVLRVTEGGVERAVTPETELVVAGYPRSGNTFALTGIRRAQPRDVSTSSHIHTPSQVLRAVRLGRPTLLVVRDPVDAATSLLIAAPYLRPGLALKEWIRFHERVLGVRAGCVVASFERVTTDLDGVVDDLNARFRTSFRRPGRDGPTSEAILADIEQDDARKRGGVASERHVPRPSSERDAMKAELRTAFRAERLGPLVDRAGALYRELVGTP